jgi:hypothetical protein
VQVIKASRARRLGTRLRSALKARILSPPEIVVRPPCQTTTRMVTGEAARFNALIKFRPTGFDSIQRF